MIDKGDLSMFLRILGCPDKRFKSYVREAAEFFGQTLITNKRLYDNINLTIKFNKKLDFYGYSSVEGFNDNWKPREFMIQIRDGLGVEDVFETLAHEMVHVKQFAKGETNASLSRWHGAVIDPDAIEYYYQPWEIEAYGREEGLYMKFMVKHELWKIFKGIKNPHRPIKNKKIVWKTLDK